MSDIDIKELDQASGAVYFVVGRGTEGGGDSYKLSVAGVSPSEWGTVSAVAQNSGYSIGTIQVDLGQRGQWPLGAIAGRPLKAGEETYTQAIVREAAAYAKAHQLPFPTDTAKLETTLQTHGDGEGRRGSLRFISKEHRDTFNAWASSDEGKGWIHQTIDVPQVRNATQVGMDILSAHGSHIPQDKQFEVLCALAKTANQLPGVLPQLEKVLKNGGDYADFTQELDEIKEKYRYFAAKKAAQVGGIYERIHQDPRAAAWMHDAHEAVTRPHFQPASEAEDARIQVALNALRGQSYDPNGLKLGDRSPAVQALQQALKDQGFNIRPDGDFGQRTKDAVKAFQERQGMTGTGVADAHTLDALGIPVVNPSRNESTLDGPIARPQGAGTPSPLTQAQEQERAAVLRQLSAPLALHGHPPERIERIGAAVMLHNEQNAQKGKPEGVLLSRDGQTILVRHEHFLLSELKIADALDGTGPAAPQATAIEPPQRESQTALMR